MSVEQDLLDAPMVAAIEELSALITARHPGARFEIGHSEDPEGVYVRAIVDTDDLDSVADLFIDRLVELQVEQGLSIYVVPVYPHERLPTVQPSQTAVRVA